MKKDEKILEVNNLSFSFNTYAGEVKAVRSVSFSLKKGETLGIVGESGCGKSVTAKSIVRLNSGENGVYKNGSILFNGSNILNIDRKELLKVRAKDIRMIFQDPMTSLNPTMKVGKQISEGIINANHTITKKQASEIAIKTLQNMGIANAKDRYNHYPHQYSGGMRQRAMIALAMAVNPQLLIADEPTTALDVTLQAQILALIKDLQKTYDTAIVLITHDLGVVANITTHIAVMYAGKIVEYGKSEDIFAHPLHPYTWGILLSIPPIDSDCSEPLHPIHGTPPDLFNPPNGCPFTSRCPYAMQVCKEYYPQTFASRDNHNVNCWLYHTHSKVVTNPITCKEASL